MSFLPAICSLVKDECDERMVPDGVGPVAVILCVTSVKVVEVAKLCRKFLTGFGNDARVVTGFGEQNIKRIVVSLPALIFRNRVAKQKLYEMLLPLSRSPLTTATMCRLW